MHQCCSHYNSGNKTILCKMHLRLRSSTPVVDHILLALFMFGTQQCNLTCKCLSQYDWKPSGTEKTLPSSFKPA